MVTFLTVTGFPLNWVLALDIKSFNGCIESAVRVKYQQKTEDAWTSMIAAQGTKEVMEKQVKQWQKVAKIKAPKASKRTGSADDFLKRFGGGF